MADKPQKLVVDLSHDGCVHDVQPDPYGKFLATCGSDGKVKIYEVKGDSHGEVCSLDAHEGGVWQVAWAHPRAVGNVSTIASCGEDGRVQIWRDMGSKKWAKMYTSPHVHEGGAVALSWAPHEHGCYLVSGGADGVVAVLCKPSGADWSINTFNAHSGGVTGASWAPIMSSGTLIQPSQPGQNLASVKRFVTGGCDGQLRVWMLNSQRGAWESVATMSEHCRNGVVAIRDVQWARNCGLPFDYIASCADDKLVLVWRQVMPDKEWKHRTVLQTDMTPCRLSWSTNGTLLAISFEDHTVSVWKEESSADWRMVSRISQ
eukprot:TRINITY_DN36506_c0_g1_i1.p1 TRINITY_DN36506_c0_g1~~TRINITY_DN36506_c0_g1_i1.p1  ORF type:complete len:348 (+),score=88.13 TRINITY_DN36506_c0_g1_i1:94-1044(+)